VSDDDPRAVRYQPTDTCLRAVLVPLLAQVDHLGIVVSSLGSSVEFYGALLGAEPAFRKSYTAKHQGRLIGYPGATVDVAMFRLPGTTSYLELIEYVDPPGELVHRDIRSAGHCHICLETRQISSEFDRLIALGAKSHSVHPISVPEDPDDPYARSKAAYFSAPDGTTIELVEFTTTNQATIIDSV
jgi:catechol 2,3-dioxygenase-like lactoylglutathione lyase family enzyme